MSITIVHLSDLHLRENWHEEQGFVLNEFYSDLKSQLTNPTSTFVFFTGDILQSGSDLKVYSYFDHTFGKTLNDLGLASENIVVVPGNHDIDRDYTRTHLSFFKGLQEQRLSESEFNDAVYGAQCEHLRAKFLPFLQWQASHSNRPLTEHTFCGQGFDLSPEIGVYCLNTAIYSFGGLRDTSGSTIGDYKELPIETRRLNAWLEQSTHRVRILAMHHPFDWLTDWAEQALSVLSYRHFDIVLSGHIHEQRSIHFDNGTDSLLHCTAPQLFSSKNDTLGYSLLTIDVARANVTVSYRQWAQDRFVTGTHFSKNDTGTIHFSLGSYNAVGVSVPARTPFEARILNILQCNFDNCLKCYTSFPPVWVLPNLADRNEFDTDNDSTILLTADQLRGPFTDCIIVAPRQFGLTSLGHYLALTEWKLKPGQFAMYIESNSLPNHESAILAYIQQRLSEIGIASQNLVAFILDQNGQINPRQINNLKKLFPHVPLTILNGIDDNAIALQNETSRLQTQFSILYLWSLERAQMRTLVQQFISAGHNLDEDSALQRLVDDLEMLNIHRTPLNCLTLLAVYASGIDYSPVNRVDMFERFLFLIFFNYKKLPDYSRVPDMKDALAVVGAFCETLIRRRRNRYQKSEFIVSSTKFCEKMSIDVDCAELFEVMHRENIVVRANDLYCFRYVHWIYFFGAHRMHHSTQFRDYILQESRYMNFPEIVEFYSGIDRRREELLTILITDLRAANEAFETRTGINSDFQPYSAARWNPNDREIANLQDHLKEEVAQSSLPVELKDKIADESYDRTVPYRQEMTNFVRDSSLLNCIQILTAAARALRNSDYVESEKKAVLLGEILRAWSKQMQVMFLLSPIIAEERFAIFDRVGFILAGTFDELEGEELWRVIVGMIPISAVTHYEKDIVSPRMGPLFENVLETDQDETAAFLLAGVVARSRPAKWYELMSSYIRRLPRNSFFLLKLFQIMRYEYKYGFVDSKTRERMLELVSLTIAKHETRAKSPNKKLIQRVKDQLRSKLDGEEDDKNREVGNGG